MCICIVRREGKKEHGVQSRHQEVMSVFVGKEHQKPLFILFYLPLLPFFQTPPPNQMPKNSKKKEEEEEEETVVVRINHEVASS